MLETVIVLPVLFIFMLVVMELSMLYNAKQLANYAAFCAARTAAVHGVDSTAKRHFAAAMAMSSIASGTNDDANNIMLAYGVTDPNQTMAALCSIPGFQNDSAKWRGRLANAYLRTFLPECDTTGTPSGRRKHVTVRVTYIYRCSFFPFGIFWGQAGINAYRAALTALFGGTMPLSVSAFANQLVIDWRR
ncbi:pilus assembly protein, partial [candidate division WOR-3 bacterium]|nr:pilus assembly protein [candidate division WOR-3 bacterium]